MGSGQGAAISAATYKTGPLQHGFSGPNVGNAEAEKP